MPLEEFKRIVPLSDPDTLEEMEEVEDLNIKYLLNQGATEYRKRPLRMHLIEPFLIVLNRRGVVASPRDLPLSHMTDALFDWVGIEQVHRPTKTGIRAIARYIAGWIEERGAEYGRESGVTQRPIN